MFVIDDPVTGGQLRCEHLQVSSRRWSRLHVTKFFQHMCPGLFSPQGLLKLSIYLSMEVCASLKHKGEEGDNTAADRMDNTLSNFLVILNLPVLPADVCEFTVSYNPSTLNPVYPDALTNQMILRVEA